MRIRHALAAVAAVVATVPAAPAEAAPVVGARVCTSDEYWTFSLLTLTPRIITPGNASVNYTAYCPFRVMVDTAAPFIVTSTQGPYNLSNNYGYVGNCVVAVLTDGLTGGGVLIGGAVGVVYSTSVGTFQNVSVKALIPSPDVCSQSSASGTGVTVGTLP